jgi:hypothetical protein
MYHIDSGSFKLRGSPIILMFDFVFSSSRHIENYVPATLKKRHNAHPNITGKNREQTLAIHLHNEYDAPQHHPPMPPTKAMGVIKQNPRGRPTATP